MTTVFTPTGNTVNVTADSSGASVALTILGGTSQQGSRSIRVYNALSEDVFIAFGDSSITTATTTGVPIPAGGVEVFEVSPKATHLAARTASGSGSVYATSGRGG